MAEELAVGRGAGVGLPNLETLGWLRIVESPHRRILPLAVDLGRGEREVLALCTERPNALALLDDGLARRYARHLGVAFTGTLGILLRGKKEGRVATIGPIIDRLGALGFRLDPQTRDHVLELAGEARER